MAVEKVGEEYKCNICGNEVKVTKAGGGELVGRNSGAQERASSPFPLVILPRAVRRGYPFAHGPSM